ncbi:MAG: aminotransferase class V-fold PLP-dependent enzyme [Xanthomonadales bacterium]|nr:aminotransferase class V-fold PLP-dependent enzyme [Xanthomonadales bacterium]
MSSRDPAPETLAVHAGAGPDPATGAVAPPLHLATTFRHGPAGERVAGYEYQREGNPALDALESALATLEGGTAALAFATGMAAIDALLQSLPPGSHVLLPQDCYTGLRALARDVLQDRGIGTTAVDMTDPAAVAAALRPDTRLVWVETPSNPGLAVSDIAAIATIARRHGALLAVDSTFATPMLQQPLRLGADVVMHSLTKYVGGHSDVMGGALVFGERPELHAKVAHRRHLTGGTLAPFNAWLLLRGLRSLPARMHWHCRNAMAVARFLAAQPAVAWVLYPGLPDHPGHATALRQMRDFGGMLSIRLRGGRDAALALAGALRLFTNATSLGGTESLVEHRASVEGDAPMSPTDLLRLSVGLEHADDLIADLAQALASIDT